MYGIEMKTRVFWWK